MSSQEMQSTSMVSYTVKDLFDKVDRRFDKQDALLEAISLRMDGMATKEEVTEIHHRVDGLADKVAHIEDERSAEKIAAGAVAEKHTQTARRAWGVTTAIVVPLLVAFILIYH